MSRHYEKKITRRIWYVIPTPDTVIPRVNELEKREPDHFIFTDRKGRIIGDAELTGVETGGNQEPPQTQLTNEIEVISHI